MDQKINDYLESLVNEVLKNPAFSSLSEEQRNATAEKTRDYLYNVIFDTVIDRLSMEQLNEIKDLSMNSPEMISKIQEFSAFMPSLAEELEKKLAQTVSDIKQNPQILN